MAVSLNNSTNINVPNGQAFIGLYDDVLEFSSINISINTDATYSIDIYYSTNKSTVDFTEHFDFTVVEQNRFLVFSPKSRYFKLKYTCNSESTSLIIQTIYKNYSNSISIDNFPSVQTVDGSVSVENLNGVGVWLAENALISHISNFPLDNDNNLKVSIQNTITTDISGQYVNVANLNFPTVQDVSGSVVVSNLSTDVNGMLKCVTENFPTNNNGNLRCDVMNTISTDISGQYVKIANTPTDYAKEATLGSVYSALTLQATATNQTSSNTKLDSIITNTSKISNFVFDSNNSLMVNIDADQSPALANSANQVTGNTSLSTIATNTTNLSSVLYSGSYYYKTILAGALPSNGVVYPSTSFGGKTCYRLHAFNSDTTSDLFLFIYDSAVTSPTLPLSSSLKFVLAVPHGQLLKEENLGLYVGANLRIGLSSSPSTFTAFTSGTSNFLINISSNPY